MCQQEEQRVPVREKTNLASVLTYYVGWNENDASGIFESQKQHCSRVECHCHARWKTRAERRPNLRRDAYGHVITSDAYLNVITKVRRDNHMSSETSGYRSTFLLTMSFPLVARDCCMRLCARHRCWRHPFFSSVLLSSSSSSSRRFLSA